MKHSVTAEAKAIGRKIDGALPGRAYTALGFICCAGVLLALALRRSKSLVGNWT